MSEFDPYAYRLSVQKKNVDGVPYFVGTVAELPDVEVYEDSPSAAIDELISIIEAYARSAQARGASIPAPIATPAASGRVTLRLPKSLHKRLDQLATEEAVSLNQLLVSFLTQAATVQELDQGHRRPIARRTFTWSVHRSADTADDDEVPREALSLRQEQLVYDARPVPLQMFESTATKTVIWGDKHAA